jgi:hypothetical protein
LTSSIEAYDPGKTPETLVAEAMAAPEDGVSLQELAKGKKKIVLIGAAVAFAIAAILVVTAKRKPRRNWLIVGLIFSAIAGFIGAVSLAYHRKNKQRDRLKVEEIFDRFDADKMEEHISEVLGKVSEGLLDE